MKYNILLPIGCFVCAVFCFLGAVLNRSYIDAGACVFSLCSTVVFALDYRNARAAAKAVSNQEVAE